MMMMLNEEALDDLLPLDSLDDVAPPLDMAHEFLSNNNDSLEMEGATSENINMDMDPFEETITSPRMEAIMQGGDSGLFPMLQHEQTAVGAFDGPFPRTVSRTTSPNINQDGTVATAIPPTIPEHQNVNVLPMDGNGHTMDQHQHNEHDHGVSIPIEHQAPPKRRHRRAATDSYLGYLYGDQNQEQTRNGPAVATDPLNAIANSFVAETQFRGMMSQQPPTRAMQPFQTTVAAPSAGPVFHQTNPANHTMQVQGNPFNHEHNSPASVMVLGGTDEILDLNQASTSTQMPLSAAPPNTTKSNAFADVPTPSSAPSNLSRFLDTLQAQADQESARLKREITIRPTRKRDMHRRIHSEMPHSEFVFMAPAFQHQQAPIAPTPGNLPTMSFDMGDLKEDAALFNKQNQQTAWR